MATRSQRCAGIQPKATMTGLCVQPFADVTCQRRSESPVGGIYTPVESHVW